MSDEPFRNHIRTTLDVLVRAEALAKEKDRERDEANRVERKSAFAAGLARVIDGFKELQVAVNEFPWKDGRRRIRCDVEVCEVGFETVARLHFDWAQILDLAEQSITVKMQGSSFKVENFRVGYGTLPSVSLLTSADEVLLMATKATAYWIALRNS